MFLNIIICIALFVISHTILTNFIKKTFLISNISISIIIALIGMYVYTVNNNPKVVQSNTLKIGISPDYYPYTFINNDKEIAGLDIDLINEIGLKLNKKIEFQVMSFESLLPSLQLRKIDALIGGMAITKERKRVFRSSIPYIKNNELCILTLKKNNVNSIDNIKNKIGITINGYTTYQYLTNQEITKNITTVKSLPDGLLNLDMGKGYFFIVGKSSISKIPDISLKYNILNLKDSQEIIGIFFNQNNTDLCTQINNALTELKQNHTLERLIKKWNL